LVVAPADCEEDEALAAAAVRARFGAIAERGRVITRELSLDPGQKYRKELFMTLSLNHTA
jgi:hypothetical protein